MQKARGLTLSLGEDDEDKKEDEEDVDKKEDDKEETKEDEVDADINDRETSPEKK